MYRFGWPQVDDTVITVLPFLLPWWQFQNLTHVLMFLHALLFSLTPQQQNPLHQSANNFVVSNCCQVATSVAQIISNIYYAYKPVSWKSTGPIWLKFIGKVLRGMAMDWWYDHYVVIFVATVAISELLATCFRLVNILHGNLQYCGNS